MKSFKKYILSETRLESSKFFKLSPYDRGFYLSVGFSISPQRVFQQQGLRSATAYNLDRRDGWFRKIEGAGKNYGLMIRDVKLSGKKMPAMPVNNIHIYPVNVTYLPSEFDEDNPANYKKAQMTMYINTNMDATVTPQDVIDYVNRNSKNWIP